MKTHDGSKYIFAHQNQITKKWSIAPRCFLLNENLFEKELRGQFISSNWFQQTFDPKKEKSFAVLEIDAHQKITKQWIETLIEKLSSDNVCLLDYLTNHVAVEDVWFFELPILNEDCWKSDSSYTAECTSYSSRIQLFCTTHVVDQNYLVTTPEFIISST